MTSGILLIVGLGNPGEEYEHTRHNAGAWLVQQLAQETHSVLRSSTKFSGLHAIASFNEGDCHLLIPTTFMNLSGKSVQALANFYKINPKQILVVHDEIDLPVGDIRLKFAGGTGGHNGLRDIIRHLNTNDFYRLRIGIGHPGNSKLVHDYVLHPPKQAEREPINQAITNGKNIIPFMLKNEFQKAMQELHTKNLTQGN